MLKNIQLYLDTFVESLNSAESVIIYDSTIATNSNQFSEKSADHGSVAVIKNFGDMEMGENGAFSSAQITNSFLHRIEPRNLIFLRG